MYLDLTYISSGFALIEHFDPPSKQTIEFYEIVLDGKFYGPSILSIPSHEHPWI